VNCQHWKASSFRATGSARSRTRTRQSESVEPLLGKPSLADQLSPEWVVGRLMREATDFGTRSRQTARVSALKTLADVLGMTDKREPGEEKSAVQRALEELPPEERRDLIRQKLAKLGYEVKREP